MRKDSMMTIAVGLVVILVLVIAMLLGRELQELRMIADSCS